MNTNGAHVVVPLHHTILYPSTIIDGVDLIGSHRACDTIAYASERAIISSQLCHRPYDVQRMGPGDPEAPSSHLSSQTNHAACMLGLQLTAKLIHPIHGIHATWWIDFELCTLVAQG